MEQAVDIPAEPPAPAVADEPAPQAVATRLRALRQRPDWWHRDHPVFVPLAGFFSGMAFIILVPGTYGALLKALVGYERAEQLFPFVLLALVVPIGLLVPAHTRKFARYMLFGVAATAIVVVGVAVLVLWVLINKDA